MRFFAGWQYLFNAMLREYTSFSIQSRDGQWILRGPYGILTPVGTKTITVPVKDKFKKQQ